MDTHLRTLAKRIPDIMVFIHVCSKPANEKHREGTGIREIARFWYEVRKRSV